jgi:hypothetical protein
MVVLKATNKQLLSGMKYSYLTANYDAATATIYLTNIDGFAANDYVLLGEFGQETSEIVQVGVVTAATNSMTISATKFPHPESTRVTILRFNKVRFYHTTTTTFSTAVWLDSPAGTDIQADSLYTKYEDSVYSTGYGWFVFYNSSTTTATTNSNAIPYGDFAENSVKKAIDAFFSMLNNKERTLVTSEDAMRWLNEGYSRAVSELNLINNSYNVADQKTITVTSGQSEYDFVTDLGITDFSEIISVTDAQGIAIEPIDINELLNYKYDTWAVSVTKYYLRYTKIGFVPTPTATLSFYLYYKTKATAFTSLYDTLDLPDGNFYFLLDYMMYRACPKLGRTSGEAQQYITAYTAGLSLMKVTSVKQIADGDHWNIAREANK